MELELIAVLFMRALCEAKHGHHVHCEWLSKDGHVTDQQHIPYYFIISYCVLLSAVMCALL